MVFSVESVSVIFDRLFCAPLRCILGRRPARWERAGEADLPQEVELSVQPVQEFLPNLPKFPDLDQRAIVAPSAFLARLPLEIRLKIYELVLGGNVFHLERTFTRVIHQARFSCVSHLRSKFWEFSVLPLGGRWFDGANLALLLSCRQIYTEAVSILYSQNTFHFNDPMALIILVTYCLPPQFVLALRSVQITYYYKEMEATTDFDHERFSVEAWWRMWQLIKEMHLTDLLLELIFEDTDVNGNEEWRKPMLEVENLKTFNLELLCWRGARPSDDARNLVNHSLDIAEPVRQRIMTIVSEGREEPERDWHQLQQKSARIDSIRRQDPSKWNIHET